MTENSDKPGLALPERVIPTPTMVSPEAQAFLVRRLGALPPENFHTDKDAWRVYVAQVESLMLPIAEQRAQPFPATIACPTRRFTKSHPIR
jgi:hypothetical protein